MDFKFKIEIQNASPEEMRAFSDLFAALQAAKQPSPLYMAHEEKTKLYKECLAEDDYTDEERKAGDAIEKELIEEETRLLETPEVEYIPIEVFEEWQQDCEPDAPLITEVHKQEVIMQGGMLLPDENFKTFPVIDDTPAPVVEKPKAKSGRKPSPSKIPAPPIEIVTQAVPELTVTEVVTTILERNLSSEKLLEIVRSVGLQDVKDICTSDPKVWPQLMELVAKA
jgi:hypothetical protein